MIIKSSLRAGFKKTGNYLEAQGENERTRLVHLSDPHVSSVSAAFRAMWAIAEGANLKKAIHHVSVNPMPYEMLSDNQIMRVCSLLECKYGYRHGEHQNIIVEHVKKGRQHFHLAWSRVNCKSGRAHYPFMHQLFSFIAARQIESEFHLEPPTPRSGRSIEPWRQPVWSPAPHRLSAWPDLDEDGVPKRRKRKDGGEEGGAMGVQSTPFSIQIEKPVPNLGLDFALTAKGLATVVAPDRRQRQMSMSSNRRRLRA